MKVKRFNEDVGFDDEQMRDRLEIANLKGEFEPSSITLKTYSLPQTKINTDTEIRKVVFREGVLEKFKTNTTIIEGSKLISFFATSKNPIDGVEYYAQFSFAYHNGQYYVGAIFRDRLDFEDEKKWSQHTFFFNNIEDVYKKASDFVKVCQKLNIINSQDLSGYFTEQN